MEDQSQTPHLNSNTQTSHYSETYSNSLDSQSRRSQSIPQDNTQEYHLDKKDYLASQSEQQQQSKDLQFQHIQFESDNQSSTSTLTVPNQKYKTLSKRQRILKGLQSFKRQLRNRRKDCGFILLQKEKMVKFSFPPVHFLKKQFRQQSDFEQEFYKICNARIMMMFRITTLRDHKCCIYCKQCKVYAVYNLYEGKMKLKSYNNIHFHFFNQPVWRLVKHIYPSLPLYIPDNPYQKQYEDEENIQKYFEYQGICRDLSDTRTNWQISSQNMFQKYFIDGVKDYETMLPSKFQYPPTSFYQKQINSMDDFIKELINISDPWMFKLHRLVYHSNTKNIIFRCRKCVAITTCGYKKHSSKFEIISFSNIHYHPIQADKFISLSKEQMANQRIHKPIQFVFPRIDSFFTNNMSKFQILYQIETLDIELLNMFYITFHSQYIYMKCRKCPAFVIFSHKTMRMLTQNRHFHDKQDFNTLNVMDRAIRYERQRTLILSRKKLASFYTSLINTNPHLAENYKKQQKINKKNAKKRCKINNQKGYMMENEQSSSQEYNKIQDFMSIRVKSIEDQFLIVDDKRQIVLPKIKNPPKFNELNLKEEEVFGFIYPPTAFLDKNYGSQNDFIQQLYKISDKQMFKMWIYYKSNCAVSSYLACGICGIRLQLSQSRQNNRLVKRSNNFHIHSISQKADLQPKLKAMMNNLILHQLTTEEQTIIPGSLSKLKQFKTQQSLNLYYRKCRKIRTIRYTPNWKQYYSKIQSSDFEIRKFAYPSIEFLHQDFTDYSHIVNQLWKVSHPDLFSRLHIRYGTNPSNAHISSCKLSCLDCPIEIVFYKSQNQEFLHFHNANNLHIHPIPKIKQTNEDKNISILSQKRLTIEKGGQKEFVADESKLFSTPNKNKTILEIETDAKKPLVFVYPPTSFLTSNFHSYKQLFYQLSILNQSEQYVGFTRFFRKQTNKVYFKCQKCRSFFIFQVQKQNLKLIKYDNSHNHHFNDFKPKNFALYQSEKYQVDSKNRRRVVKNSQEEKTLKKIKNCEKNISNNKTPTANKQKKQKNKVPQQLQANECWEIVQQQDNCNKSLPQQLTVTSNNSQAFFQIFMTTQMKEKYNKYGDAIGLHINLRQTYDLQNQCCCGFITGFDFAEDLVVLGVIVFEKTNFFIEPILVQYLKRVDKYPESLTLPNRIQNNNENTFHLLYSLYNMEIVYAREIRKSNKFTGFQTQQLSNKVIAQYLHRQFKREQCQKVISEIIRKLQILEFNAESQRECPNLGYIFEDDRLIQVGNILGPKTIERFMQSYNRALGLGVYFADDTKIIFEDGGEHYTTILEQKVVCTCGQYDRSKLPCAHIIYFARQHKQSYLEFVGDRWKRHAKQTSQEIKFQ